MAINYILKELRRRRRQQQQHHRHQKGNQLHCNEKCHQISKYSSTNRSTCRLLIFISFFFFFFFWHLVYSLRVFKSVVAVVLLQLLTCRLINSFLLSRKRTLVTLHWSKNHTLFYCFLSWPSCCCCFLFLGKRMQKGNKIANSARVHTIWCVIASILSE